MLPLIVCVKPSDPTAFPWGLWKTLPQGQVSYIVGPVGLTSATTVSEDSKDSCSRQKHRQDSSKQAMILLIFFPRKYTMPFFFFGEGVGVGGWWKVPHVPTSFWHPLSIPLPGEQGSAMWAVLFSHFSVGQTSKPRAASKSPAPSPRPEMRASTTQTVMSDSLVRKILV